MDNYLKHLGNWPKNVAEAVKNREILVISPEDTLDFINGELLLEEGSLLSPFTLFKHDLSCVSNIS